MHEQCNSFLQKVYFLKIVYTMSCNSYLQNMLFFSDNSFFKFSLLLCIVNRINSYSQYLHYSVDKIAALLSTACMLK